MRNSTPRWGRFPAARFTPRPLGERATPVPVVAIISIAQRIHLEIPPHPTLPVRSTGPVLERARILRRAFAENFAGVRELLRDVAATGEQRQPRRDPIFRLEVEPPRRREIAIRAGRAVGHGGLRLA